VGGARYSIFKTIVAVQGSGREPGRLRRQGCSRVMCLLGHVSMPAGWRSRCLFRHVEIRRAEMRGRADEAPQNSGALLGLSQEQQAAVRGSASRRRTPPRPYGVRTVEIRAARRYTLSRSGRPPCWPDSSSSTPLSTGIVRPESPIWSAPPLSTPSRSSSPCRGRGRPSYSQTRHTCRSGCGAWCCTSRSMGRTARSAPRRGS
jgi:hypothetical protein